MPWEALMSYIPDSYLQAKDGLDRIANDVAILIEAAESRFGQIKSFSTQLSNLSANAPTGWLELVQYINQEAAANPSDEDWARLKSEKDKIVADFQAYKSVLDAKIAAYEAA